MFFYIILTILILYILIQYNSMVTRKKKAEQAKSTIDVYLTQRFDLIPNLVTCVKQYMNYEQEVYTKITEMRTKYMNTKNLSDGANLNNFCNHILLDAEAYPDLKANEQFLMLEKQLTKMENQLQAARRLYNSEVTLYNTKISVVPSNIVAKLFGFKEFELFQLEEGKDINIDVKL